MKRKRELCERCGFPILARRKGSSYCTDRCAKAQEEDDRVSIEMELAEQEHTPAKEDE